MVLVRGGVNKGLVEKEETRCYSQTSGRSRCYKGFPSWFKSVVVCGRRYSETIHSSQPQFEAGWTMPGQR